MKKFLIIILFFACSINLNYAQSVKNFSGDKMVMYHKGKENYKYYESNNSVIKHGQYTFTGNQKIGGDDTKLTISGYFENGKETGNWSGSLSGVKSGKNVNLKINGQYKDGLPSGKWIIDYTAIQNGRTYYQTCSANFLNGHFVGELSYKDGWKDNTNPNEVIDIEFDNEGYLNSKIGIYDYKHGIDKNDKDMDYTDFEAGIAISKDGDLYTLIEKSGYIDFHYSQVSGIHHSLNKAFTLFGESLNPIFQVANFERKIYVTKVWGNLHESDISKLEQKMKLAESENNTELVKKYNFYINFLKGNLAYKSNNLDKTVIFYTEAMNYGENSTITQRLNECKNKIEVRDKEFNNFLTQAEENFKKYQFKEAKALYEKAKAVKNDNYCQNKIDLINDMQNDGDKYYKIAYDFYQKNDLDSAIHYFRVVDYFNPNIPTVLNTLGWIYLVNKQFEEALTVLEKAKSVTNSNDNVYMYILGNLAHSYLLTGNTDKAKEIYYNNKKKQVGDKLWEDMVVSDFNKFIDLGIKNDFYYEIAKKLGRKKDLKQTN